jgi:hypothetical protein
MAISRRPNTIQCHCQDLSSCTRLQRCQCMVMDDAAATAETPKDKKKKINDSPRVVRMTMPTMLHRRKRRKTEESDNQEEEGKTPKDKKKKKRKTEDDDDDGEAKKSIAGIDLGAKGV